MELIICKNKTTGLFSIRDERTNEGHPVYYSKFNGWVKESPDTEHLIKEFKKEKKAKKIIKVLAPQ